MSFESFTDFLAMGGHGLYVWLAYGASVAVVLANVVAVRLAWRRHLKRLRARQPRAQLTPATTSTTSGSSS